MGECLSIKRGLDIHLTSIMVKKRKGQVGRVGLLKSKPPATKPEINKDDILLFLETEKNMLINEQISLESQIYRLNMHRDIVIAKLVGICDNLEDIRRMGKQDNITEEEE